MVKAFKVFKRRKDGTLGSLFVDCRRRIAVGKWIEAKDAFRPTWLSFLPGWHSHADFSKAKALLKAADNRVMYEVLVKDIVREFPNGRVVSRWIKLVGLA